ncbi:transmembrane emp24 domain-containing protein 5-like [Cryptotermes secundus]|uniref:transmembrane emp24 domain-containing protein 5-like n=1 Tax=Cryptotermes secundus TaxID=105785 RepID=UPI000CD7CC44|nr:transmembrane emp24 domain-containing protein 5-like [Cryptotermes secundus]
MLKRAFILYLVPIVVRIESVMSFEKEMTISIDSRREECFYQPVKRGQVIDVEYQVIDGGQGEIDISFHLATPSGRIVVSDLKKPENSHRIEASEEGDYRLCWDNTFSHFNSKTVFFEIIIESDDDDERDPWDIDFENYGGLSPEELYDIKIQDIQDAINRVRTHLVKIRHIQDTLRAFEARDRNIAEGNFVRVNYWSMIQIAVMLFVGLIQVVMVKSLFDDKSRVHRFWKSGITS